MVPPHLPFARLDRFIERKKDELARLLEKDASPSQREKWHSKAAHLRKVITQAKQELTQIENSLCRREDILQRLQQRQREHERCCKHLTTQLTSSTLYRELFAESQRLLQRVKALESKLDDSPPLK